MQVHGMDADPIFIGEGDIDAARELVHQAENAELFLYPGDQQDRGCSCLVVVKTAHADDEGAC